MKYLRLATICSQLEGVLKLGQRSNSTLNCKASRCQVASFYNLKRKIYKPMTNKNMMLQPPSAYFNLSWTNHNHSSIEKSLFLFSQVPISHASVDAYLMNRLFWVTSDNLISQHLANCSNSSPDTKHHIFHFSLSCWPHSLLWTQQIKFWNKTIMSTGPFVVCGRYVWNVQFVMR